MTDPPEDSAPLVVCFPYAGNGASLFRKWPRLVGGAHVRALQLPGRENRVRDPLVHAVPDYGRAIARFLLPHRRRGLVLFGHCSGSTYALETATALRALVPDENPPLHVVASGWGPPHRARYGWMNFVDLDAFDAPGAVRTLLAGAGSSAPDELVAMMAEVLLHDLRVQRGYLWPADRRLAWPTTVVSWAHDDVVDPGLVHDGWDDLGEVEHVHGLDGDHYDFVSCPDRLVAVLEDVVGRVSRERAGSSA